VKAYARSILHLFDGKRRYLVPLFQRQYVWTRDKQWAPLWDDMARMAERLRVSPDGPPHFMGAIVLDQVRTFGNQVPAHLIIDGQQRLTTFQLVLAAVRDVAQELQAEVYASEIDRYLRNSGIMEKSEEEQFKVWPSHVDQAAFRGVIDSTAPSADGTHRIVLCYRFFLEAVKGFTRSNGRADEAKRGVELLYHVLRDALEVVSIELEGDDDPQVIFETLNARGEPLLPSDLLRNFLFWRAERNREDKDRLYAEYWAPLDQKFWKVEERLGRLKRPRIDIFLQHYLESQTAAEVNVARLFHEYKLWIRDQSPFQTIEAELESLAANSNVYRVFIEADPHAVPHGVFLSRVKQLDVGTVYPLLLFILAHPDRDGQDVSGMLLDIESYLFRRFICGLTTKNYNRVFLQLIRDLRSGAFRRETLRTTLKSLTGEAVVWPDDQKLTQAWLSRDAYKQIKSQRLILILKAIEDRLRTEKAEQVSVLSPLSVEHVMPQEWYGTWPLSDGTLARPWYERLLEKEVNAEADERDRVVHTFGNLTLLTYPLNSSVSNSSWQVKRPEICKQSALALNRYFQDEPMWDVAQIERRGRELLETAIKVWPY
jgi:uncharacterized protein with ParB-like and HNH nuclease domain